jgi:AraC-like DNA-binding protein
MSWVDDIETPFLRHVASLAVFPSTMRYTGVDMTAMHDSITTKGGPLSGLVLDRNPEQQELADLERRISEGLTKLREAIEAASPAAPNGVDPEYAKRWIETARRLSVQLSNDLPPQLEPEAVAEIRKIIINLLAALQESDEARPLDALDRFFVDSEAIRQIVRDALDEHAGCRDDDARPLVAYLQQALPRVTQADQARLAGVSTRHLQRLGKEGGTPPYQLVLAVRLVRLLRHVWNPEGVVAWFHRERTELDGHAPIDLASEPGFERALVRLARQGRAGHGA